MFLACMFSYMIRTNLSITIVAMVNTTKEGDKGGPACNYEGVGNVSQQAAVLKDVS